MPMQKASLYSSDPRLTINPLCGERIERPREAADAMTIALSQGTQDAQLFYHAGIIERSQGHADIADQFLARARSLNSQLDGVRLATR